LQARQELGTTLIVASHDWQWLYEICDEVLHLYNGKVFGTGRETIIFGPWQNLASGKWGKNLSDNQQLLVPSPPSKEAAAVIEVLSISEYAQDTPDEHIVLNGTVSRLSLERKTGQILATVIVGDLPLTVGLTFQQAKANKIFPGKSIFIRYCLDQIKWI
jgi:tungstate transport system ATP-binding protein